MRGDGVWNINVRPTDPPSMAIIVETEVNLGERTNTNWTPLPGSRQEIVILPPDPNNPRIDLVVECAEGYWIISGHPAPAPIAPPQGLVGLTSVVVATILVPPGT